MAFFETSGNRKALENEARMAGRLPPSQSLTLKWPVLHYGSIPVFDAAKWDFQISGEVEEPKRLTWNEFRALPQTEITSDFRGIRNDRITPGT
jgi:DMSO/TMAO reductase YedYZ molybdopterin-dependent catalytic subunit